MKIQIENYVLNSTNTIGWDLCEIKKRYELDKNKKRTGKTLLAEVPLAYNISIKRAVQHIIQRNLDKTDLVIELKQYLKLYKNEQDRICKLLEIEVTKLENIK